MLDRLREALKSSTADYAEIRFELEEASWLAYRGRDLETSGVSSYAGGLVRACRRGGWGVITFDTPEELGDRVAEACQCAELAGRESTRIAETPPVTAEIKAELDRDFRGVPLDEKIRLIDGYNTILLNAGPEIESTRVSYADAFRTVYFANSLGTLFMEERPRATCAFGATARDGGLVQNAYGSEGTTRSYNALTGLDARVQEVGGRACALLRAPQAGGGRHTVVLNPLMAGVFVHEAFGHLSESDFLYENPRMLDLMATGRKLGAPFLNIIDDGRYEGALGSNQYDDEGVPAAKTHLVREGVLAGHLHSRETAAKMEEAPTGNARAIRRDHPPIVRMTNTYIDRGPLSVSDLFAGIDNGIYACDAFGGNTGLEMFTFSAAYGYRSENGERGELLRDVVLSGNVFETLQNIDAVADDLVMFNGAGGCGKGGQSPLPVGLGAPHIRIRDVVIGGK